MVALMEKLVRGRATKSLTAMVNRSCPLTALILAYNEEQNIGDCLDSLSGWVQQMVVVDSGSVDATREIAKRRGARVYEHNFEGHALQWKWTLEHVAIATEWVLCLDADQRVTTELRDEICKVLSANPPQVNPISGFYLKRRQVFRGRWIKHGGYYPKYLLKLFRRDSVTFDENDLVDHHFVVRGSTNKLRHDIIEDNRKENDIGFWIRKHERYARGLAEEEFRRRDGHSSSAIRAAWFGNPDERTAAVKKLWMRLPLYVRPFFYFLYRYFLRLGFLDGKQGFIFHFLQAFWYRLLVDIHLDDLLKARAAEGSSQ